MKKESIIYLAQMESKHKVQYSTRLKQSTIEEISEISRMLTNLTDTRKAVPNSVVIEIAISEALKTLKETE